VSELYASLVLRQAGRWLLRALSIHILTLRPYARWLFLEEKATRLPGFCKEQNRKRCSGARPRIDWWIEAGYLIGRAAVSKELRRELCSPSMKIVAIPFPPLDSGAL
jgi:hypothetical protein